MHVVALGFHGDPARVARRQGSFVRYRHVRYGYLETTSEVEALKEDRIRFCLWETTGMKLSSCANLRTLHRRSLFAEVCAGEAGENICMCGDRAGRGHRVCIGTSDHTTMVAVAVAVVVRFGIRDGAGEHKYEFIYDEG